MLLALRLNDYLALLAVNFLVNAFFVYYAAQWTGIRGNSYAKALTVAALSTLSLAVVDFLFFEKIAYGWLSFAASLLASLFAIAYVYQIKVEQALVVWLVTGFFAGVATYFFGLAGHVTPST
ncbi:MAG TPA: hypothetical protein HA252_00625 [Candidatus Diapherotrites archaeon]|uniref:Uncharacterized protein n=1 Tax=Candidatus Iainarchaeum sp. TaxID=3101447 RepID=A0A7J4JDQ8_9ARCH|nr:hypothetical protein [Candidatus Diapherotrites archaeon]HIH15893.1 hypothetical protein [Candidatus Diapherotrites archaeon]